MPDQLFDMLLRNSRPVEPASADLAERIIHAARYTKRPAHIPFSIWFKELLSTILPQPAYALATALTLGIAIGLSLPVASAADTEKDFFTQNYFEEDGATL